MRHIPPLAAVRVFEAAARHGNFSRAAEELGMTQAAVSYQVKLLEERLGSALFARTGRVVVLTPLGRRIAPLVSSAFDTLDDAFAAARAESEAVLTISASSTFATNWLAVRLGAFQMTRPALAVRLVTQDAMADLAGGDADVAIRLSAEPWPGLVSHFLMRVPIAPFASPALLAEYGPIESAAALGRLPLLSPDDSWWWLWFESALEVPLDQKSARGLRLDSQVLEATAAMAGQGVAILNVALWQPQIDAGLLVQVLPHVSYRRQRYWLCYPEYCRNAPKVKAFREWLLAEFARDAADDRYGIYAE